jgi:hypothetical protein
LELGTWNAAVTKHYFQRTNYLSGGYIMNASAGSLAEMVNRSVDVLRNPSVATFERHEKRGTLQTALLYVAVAAVVAAIIGLLGGFRGALESALIVFAQFFLFAGVTYYVGKSQGGTGTVDEVGYTFSLFMVPISVVFSVAFVVLLLIPILGWCLIPFVWLGSVLAYVYFAYLAVQSSMNLRDSTRVLITLGAAALATFVGSVLVRAIV